MNEWAPRTAGQSEDGVRNVDPIVIEVIRNALSSAAEQMKFALQRTAFSVAIYEGLDFCCAVYDRKVRQLAQSRTLPQWLGTMNFCVDAALQGVGGAENLEPGDVVFVNHAYETGSHSQDAAIVVPWFIGATLHGYVTIKAHLSDLGALAPFCTSTTDNFQEGTIFPGVWLYRRGELQADVYRTLLANSRLPEVVAGDLHAEIGAAEVGTAALDRIVAKHGADTFERCVDAMIDRAEAATRALFAGVPDGRYCADGLIDSNGVDDAPVPLDVAVEVRGSDVVVDFTGCAPQQGGPCNCPFPSTVAVARVAVLSSVGLTELVNEGHFRPIEVRTRQGTVFHPIPPAPVYCWGWAGVQGVDLVHKALSSAVLHLPAGSGGDLPFVVAWGSGADGALWVSAGPGFPIGQGATAEADGAPPMFHVTCSGLTSESVEVLEARYPFLIERQELAPDSGGSGRHRGGLGVDGRIRALADCNATLVFDRTKTPPWGVAGGGPGRAGSVWVRLPGAPMEQTGKATGLPLAEGAVVEFRTGGGGGYGSADERPLDDVLSDIREGYLSEEGARAQYATALSGEPVS